MYDQDRLVVREQYVTTADGWSLALRRTVMPRTFDRNTKPLLIVPGYGMNSFIFSFHPRGTSMERTLAEAGYEVWAFDMRGQGESRAERAKPGVASLANYAAIDVPAAVERVLATTRTSASTLTLIGCSLGGSITYGYLALTPRNSVSEVIAMCAPLRWTEIHPVIRAVFSSPRLARLVRITGTRDMLRTVFPALRRIRPVISLYMNPDTIDTSQMNVMTRTVEDPDPLVNHDIAKWMRGGDMVLAGVNVTDAMRRAKLPLLVIIPNKDGIVPPSTAQIAADIWGGDDVEVLRVGDDDNWFAHANLFIADDSPRLVFDPMIRWLRRHA
jgi:pimeloyl-ACP methyl ester carboxylesterase